MAAPTFLDADAVRARLDPATALESQRRAFRALADGTGVVAPRVLLDGPGGGTVFSYLARVAADAPTVAKLGAVVPANAQRGVPAVSSTLTVLDAVTGHPRAIVDGDAVTELRTAAASALAVELLARRGAARVAVLGAGVQGAAHVRAIRQVLPTASFALWSRTPGRAVAAAASLAAEVGGVVLPHGGIRGAVEHADVVVACTSSATPVVPAASLKPGVLVISIGSFAPDRDELGAEVIDLADRVVVDDLPTAIEQAGSIRAALDARVLAASGLTALGAILIGAAPGRLRDTERIVYNSVGLGIQDAAAAQALL